MKNTFIKFITGLILCISLVFSGYSCTDASVNYPLSDTRANGDKIVLYTYTQLGHDNYMNQFHNESHFLHFSTAYKTDGTLDSITTGLNYLKGVISDGNSNTNSHSFVKILNVGGVSTGYLYTFPLPNAQQGIVIIDADELARASSWANANGLSITNVYYNPNNELYMQIIINL